MKLKNLKRCAATIDVLASVVSIETFEINKSGYLKIVYLMSDCSQEVFIFEEEIPHQLNAFEIFGISNKEIAVFNANPHLLLGLDFDATLTPKIINGDLSCIISSRKLTSID